MRSYLLIFGLIMVMTNLTGCAAERYFSGNGTEALIYEEWHSYDIDIQDSSEAQEVIATIVRRIQNRDSRAQYNVYYRSSISKTLFESVVKDFRELSSLRNQVTYRHNPHNITDLTMRVKVHAIHTAQCQAIELFKETDELNCFSESARLKQVANKQRLVGGR